jgi:phosphoglycerate dehydrogenase-like enzyme
VRSVRRPLHVLIYHPDDAHEYAAVFGPSRGVVAHVATTPDEAARLAPDVDVAYAWKLPPAFYGKAPRLRWLQAMGAGVDWALVPELPAHVTVTRVPGVFGPWMTEYVLGWCAFVTQRMETYRSAQRERRWNDRVIPTRLRGTTMLIVGLGDIGRAIARGARALGMAVVGVSRTGAAVPGIDRVFPTRALTRALPGADWVVLALPLTSGTRGLIGARELAAMQSGAWLINIARGAVVDERALVEALRRRTIAGAVLDVFTEEPLPAAHPLWDLDNVVITPHISGPSTPAELAPVFDDNLARFRAGRRLRHVVDRRRGY